MIKVTQGVFVNSTKSLCLFLRSKLRTFHIELAIASRRVCYNALFGSAVFAGLILFPVASHSQEIRGANSVQADSVGLRYFEPVPTRLGSFFLYSSASAGVSYSDNVLAEIIDKQSDTIFNTQANFLLQSNWSNHFLDFAFNVSNATYAERSEENHTDYSVSSNWQLDVTRRSKLSGSLSAARATEERGASDAPISADADEPTSYTAFRASLAFAHKFNRLTVEVGGEASWNDYDDVDAVAGGQIDQDVRDQKIYSAFIKQAYEVSPGFRVFGIVDASHQKLAEDEGAARRNSTGFDIRGGVDFEVTRVIAGSLSAGYLIQDYESSLFDRINSWSLNGSLNWNPTRMMTVNLSASRAVSETTFDLASGRIVTAVSGQVNYEILRNLIGSSYVKYDFEEYEGIDRNDNLLRLGASIDYTINGTVSVGAFYDFISKDSDVSTFAYDQNSFGANLRAKF